MAQVKITREDLQSQDLLEPGEQLQQALQKYGRPILTIALIVLLAWTGQRFYAISQQKVLMAANEQYSVAEQAYAKAMNDHDWSSPERAKAMEEVVTKLDEFLQKYPNSGLSYQARFLRGNAYYNTGDPIGQSANTDRAITAFEACAAAAKDPMDKAAALLALGSANENRFFLTNVDSFLKTAMDNYTKASQLTDAGFVADDAKLSLGRVLAFQGRKEEATKLLREVYKAREIKRKPLPADAGDSKRRMERLRQFGDQFSLSRSAAIELQKLGIDVEKEEADKVKSETKK